MSIGFMLLLIVFGLVVLLSGWILALGFAAWVDNNCRIAPTFGELWDSLKCKLGL